MQYTFKVLVDCWNLLKNTFVTKYLKLKRAEQQLKSAKSLLKYKTSNTLAKKNKLAQLLLKAKTSTTVAKSKKTGEHS